MNDESNHVHQEINNYILLLRSEDDVERRQELLDLLVRRNKDYKRLYDDCANEIVAEIVKMVANFSYDK